MAVGAEYVADSWAKGSGLWYWGSPHTIDDNRDVFYAMNRFMIFNHPWLQFRVGQNNKVSVKIIHRFNIDDDYDWHNRVTGFPLVVPTDKGVVRSTMYIPHSVHHRLIRAKMAKTYTIRINWTETEEAWYDCNALKRLSAQPKSTDPRTWPPPPSPVPPPAPPKPGLD